MSRASNERRLARLEASRPQPPDRDWAYPWPVREALADPAWRAWLLDWSEAVWAGREGDAPDPPPHPPR